MTFTVFNRDVTFSDKEMKTFQANALDLSTDFLEFMLLSIEIDNFDNISDLEAHALCIKAILNYTNVVVETLNAMEKEGLI